MKRFLIFTFFLAIVSCDDGDILFEDFDFDNITVEACLPETDTGSRSYTFFKIESTNNETLSVQLTTIDNLLELEGSYGSYDVTSFPLEYRKFNDAVSSDYFCNNVPPASPVVTEVFEATAGSFTIDTFYTFDDQDGVPPASEDINGDGDLENDDTDGDGIPNYRDDDDDGDNIPTSDEGVVTSDLNASLDTDNDGIPNYLDNDDDDDGVLTIQEDLNLNLNPGDDITGNQVNYLNPTIAVAASPAIDSYREHSFLQLTNLDINFNDLTLSNGSQEIIYVEFPFGTYVNDAITIMETPSF